MVGASNAGLVEDDLMAEARICLKALEQPEQYGSVFNWRQIHVIQFSLLPGIWVQAMSCLRTSVVFCTNIFICLNFMIYDVFRTCNSSAHELVKPGLS